MAIRDSGRANGELELSGDRVCIWEDERVLEMDSGDGGPTVWVYLLPQNSTLKNG